MVFNASMLDWLGVLLPSIYTYCPRSSSGCSGMQGICAWLTGEDLCAIALWYANIFGVAVFNASILDSLGWSICLLYICIVLDLAVGVVVCKASVLNWLGRATWGVTVFNASMLDWLGVHLSSIYMHCPISSSGCSGMQGICAWLAGEGHMKCNGTQGICDWLTGEDLCSIALWYANIFGVPVVKVPMLHWSG